MSKVERYQKDVAKQPEQIWLYADTLVQWLFLIAAAVAHEVISLTTYEVKQLPKGERKVPVKVVEQRATNFLIHVLILGRTEETKDGKEFQKDHARQ